MAKRFIDTDMFKKQFIRDLKAPYKLLWVYIMTDCNHAGIWECDFDVAQIRTGSKLNANDAEMAFAEKIIIISAGEKWFIPSFIEFQYGKLSPTNRAHTGAITLLEKYGLIDDEQNIQAPYKPLTSPLQGVKDMVKEKVKDKVKDKEGEIEIQKTPLEIAFSDWVEMRKKMKGGITDKAIELGKSELKKLASGNSDLAIAIINQTLLNSWKGFFPLKNQANGQTKSHRPDLSRVDDFVNKVLSGEITEDNSGGITG